MALYPLKLNGTTLGIAGRAEAVPFNELPINEDQVEAFFRNNLLKLLGPEENFLILGDQTSARKQTQFDLVAIDTSGNLIQIFVKNETDPHAMGESIETHILKAVARLATLKNPHELLDMLVGGGSRKPLPEDRIADQAEELNQYMIQNKIALNFNGRQKILVVAPNYEQQVINTMTWLSGNGVDVTCYQLTPIKIGAAMALDFTKVIPAGGTGGLRPKSLTKLPTKEPTRPAEAQEFNGFDGMTKTPPSMPAAAASSTSATSAPYAMPKNNVIPMARKTMREPPSLPNMQKLMDWGVLTNGDRLTIRDFEDSEAIVVDHKFVSYQGEVLTFDQWALKVTNLPAVNIYDWAFHQTKKDTLFNLRSQKMRELENLCAG